MLVYVYWLIDFFLVYFLIVAECKIVSWYLYNSSVQIHNVYIDDEMDDDD